MRRQIVLDKKDRTILRLTQKGCTIQEIADTVFLSPRGVEMRRQKLLDKFGAENVHQLIALTARESARRQALWEFQRQYFPPMFWDHTGGAHETNASV